MSSDSDVEVINAPKKKNKGGKISRTLASMLITADQEEIENRRQVLKGIDLYRDWGTYLKCTKCNAGLKSLIQEGRELVLHPILKVLYCQKCAKFYGDGEFSLDEDDEDKYCRWCGEGGRLFLCSKCICGFCPKCIRKHLGSDSLKDVENDDKWKCLICKPTPLWFLRHVTHLAVKVSKENRKTVKEQREQRIQRLLKKKTNTDTKPRRRLIRQEDSNDESETSSKKSSNANPGSDSEENSSSKRSGSKKKTQEISDSDTSAAKRKPGPRSKAKTSKDSEDDSEARSSKRKAGPKSKTRPKTDSEDESESRSSKKKPGPKSKTKPTTDSEDESESRSSKKKRGPKSKAKPTTDTEDEPESRSSKRKPGPKSKTKPTTDSEDESESRSSKKKPGPKSKTKPRTDSEDEPESRSSKRKPGPKSKTKRTTDSEDESESQASKRKPGPKSKTRPNADSEDSESKRKTHPNQNGKKLSENESEPEKRSGKSRKRGRSESECEEPQKKKRKEQSEPSRKKRFRQAEEALQVIRGVFNICIKKMDKQLKRIKALEDICDEEGLERDLSSYGNLLQTLVTHTVKRYPSVGSVCAPGVKPTSSSSTVMKELIELAEGTEEAVIGGMLKEISAPETETNGQEQPDGNGSDFGSVDSVETNMRELINSATEFLLENNREDQTDSTKEVAGKEDVSNGNVGSEDQTGLGVSESIQEKDPIGEDETMDAYVERELRQNGGDEKMDTSDAVVDLDKEDQEEEVVEVEEKNDDDEAGEGDAEKGDDSTMNGEAGEGGAEKGDDSTMNGGELGDGNGDKPADVSDEDDGQKETRTSRGQNNDLDAKNLVLATSSDNSDVSDLDGGDQEKKSQRKVRKSAGQRTRERKQRQQSTPSKSSPKSDSARIKSLTNLNSLDRVKKKRRNSDSDSSGGYKGAESSSNKKSTKRKKERTPKKSLMDMLDDIYSGSSDGEAVGSGDDTKNDIYRKKSNDWKKAALKDLVLGSSASEMSGSDTEDGKEKGVKTEKVKKAKRTKKSDETSDDSGKAEKKSRRADSVDKELGKNKRDSSCDSTADEKNERLSKKERKKRVSAGEESEVDAAKEKKLRKSESEEEKGKKSRKKNVEEASTDEEGSAKDKDGEEINIRKQVLESSESEAENTRKKIVSEDSDVEVIGSKKEVDSDESDIIQKRDKAKKIVESDSDYSGATSVDSIYKDNASDSDYSQEFTPKKKRKRIVEASGSDSDVEALTPKKGRRRNIKLLMKKDELEVETKQAVRDEEQRRKRLEERRKEYKKLFPEEDASRLILDWDETGEVLVEVSRRLYKRLKPHQKDGVRFMWDNCFESLKSMEKSNGGGCILAHCMGLGKTFQVVTLLHTVLTGDIGVNTAMVICPLNTVANWCNEFDMWMSVAKCDWIDVYDMSRYKNLAERRYQLKAWQKKGGVMIISYTTFRSLTKKKTKKNSVISDALLKPGPDIVICDEGHLLKNEKSALSKAVSEIQTCRRVVLTGTPLQNNLNEYHCMVQFIKPNILGTKYEFANRFVNPIENGQFEDSTPRDVEIMKRRSHVLHTMLSGCIQRQDYLVLTPFLPPKFEYVLSIAVSEPLAGLYRHYLNLRPGSVPGTVRLFADYQALQRIWTHPRTLMSQLEKENERKAKEAVVRENEDDYESDFIDDGTSSAESDGSFKPKKKYKTRKNKVEEEIEEVKAPTPPPAATTKPWWEGLIPEKCFQESEVSNKLVVLFSIIQECVTLGDKLLVFSQSLYSLDVIEHFLADLEIDGRRWSLGKHYFRLDGSTNIDKRAAWCKQFNRESNTNAKMFLISTKAGGLGINLVGANRVVLFDACWNPSHDLQSIFRVFRFGQTKSCYIYRLLAEATMEEKIYERQVTKLSLAGRVVDEHQIERHYSSGNLQELYNFQPLPRDQWKTPIVPKDNLLAKVLKRHEDVIVTYHEHDSLLENKQEQVLTEEERKRAWEEYEIAQNPPPPPPMPRIFPNMMGMGLPPMPQNMSVEQYMLNLQQAFPNANAANPAINQQIMMMMNAAAAQQRMAEERAKYQQMLAKAPKGLVPTYSRAADAANQRALQQLREIEETKYKHPNILKNPLSKPGKIVKPTNPQQEKALRERFAIMTPGEMIKIGQEWSLMPNEGESKHTYRDRLLQHICEPEVTVLE